jgi:hypothetical protein
MLTAKRAVRSGHSWTYDVHPGTAPGRLADEAYSPYCPPKENFYKSPTKSSIYSNSHLSGHLACATQEAYSASKSETKRHRLKCQQEPSRQGDAVSRFYWANGLGLDLDINIEK